MEKSEKLKICRNIGAEGAVLLKNENHTLPLQKGSKVAAFGRTFYYCFKGGAGSGDILGVFPINPADALPQMGVEIEEVSKKYYETYNAERYDDELKYWNRYNREWVNSLPEAPIDLETVKKSAENTDTAIISLGRSSGEWFDISTVKGGYFLTDIEEELLKNVTSAFKKTILILNYSGVMDITFAEKYNIDAMVYTSMGGEETGNSVADILVGNVSPSGKLTDSWCKLDDYITNDNITELSIPYNEGIFVGYRYFDTFGIEPIYPFGFGLSYTDFDIKVKGVSVDKTKVNLDVEVKNMGNFTGKEVVQVYLSEPEVKLPKAYQQLVAFKKTKELGTGETENLNLSFDITDFAGFYEETAQFILEKGDYYIRVGNSSRNTHIVAKITLDDTVVTFKTVNRMKPQEEIELLSSKDANPISYIGEDAEKENCISISFDKNDFAVRESLPENRVPKELQRIDQNLHTIGEVADGKITMEQFVAQFSNSELADILNGVTGNTMNVNMNVGTMARSIKGAAGEIWSSEKYGIKPCVNADGPTGIRLGGFIDKPGQIPTDTELSLKMTAFPIATCLASTWNPTLAEDFGRAVADDMETVGLEGWLAPAMNIHRSPLCGRNFEYYSEDPLISGVFGGATVKGIQLNEDGTSAFKYTTIKHFAANNAETQRFDSDSIVSERALREIYLKPFKIAIEIGKPIAVMNSYNKINGIYASDNFDLNTGILRREWGYDGCVMTDWGAKSSAVLMPNAGCDLVMPGCKNKQYLEGMESDTIPRSVAQRCAVNVMNVVLKTTVLKEKNK